MSSPKIIIIKHAKKKKRNLKKFEQNKTNIVFQVL
jgi:hypothetical protein